MKRSTLFLILAVIASFLIGCLVTQRHYERTLQGPDTVTITKWIHDSIPVPYDSIIYITRTVPLPVHDTTETHDTTFVHDSVLVDVPIWDKTYLSDNYRIVVRGFQPELVDVWLNQKETVIKIPYRKHWAFTVGPQLGVGITPKGVQPYAGVGGTFGWSF